MPEKNNCQLFNFEHAHSSNESEIKAFSDFQRLLKNKYRMFSVAKGNSEGKTGIRKRWQVQKQVIQFN